MHKEDSKQKKMDTKKTSSWNIFPSFIKKYMNPTWNVAKFLFYESRYILYPKNWFNSFGELVHDIKQIYSNTIKGENKKDYQPYIKISPVGKDFNIRITEEGEGIIKFQASRVLTGDISKLNEKITEQINYGYVKITAKYEKDEIVITIDVKKIFDEVQDNNPGKSSDEMKKLIIKKIEEKVDSTIKDIAKVCGGGFERYKENSLVAGIAQKLYQDHSNNISFNKEKTLSKSEPTSSVIHEPRVRDEDFSVTDPEKFPKDSRQKKKNTNEFSCSNTTSTIIDKEIEESLNGLKEMKEDGDKNIGKTTFTPSSTPAQINHNNHNKKM
ncbi:MAG: hypothetical protein KTV77_03065 [Wolbachia endosymbiont of Fragariocoptes setiger]|nr:hypothetical protein [Wolbachia endosymbiont of Fragariocoptes setiger]